MIGSVVGESDLSRRWDDFSEQRERVGRERVRGAGRGRMSKKTAKGILRLKEVTLGFFKQRPSDVTQ